MERAKNRIRKKIMEIFANRRTKGRRVAALVLCVSLLISGLTGCADEENNDSLEVSTPETGSYVETVLNTPEEWGTGVIKRLSKVGGKLHILLQKNVEGNAALEEWVLEEDGSFAEVTQDWLKSISFPYMDYGVTKLMENKEGNQYLYAQNMDETGSSYVGRLWKSQDGEAVEITPEKWKAVNEEFGFYEYAQDMVLLDNGTLVGYSFTSKDTFLAEDGSLTDSAQDMNRYGERLTANADDHYMLTLDDMGMVNGVSLWRAGVKEPEVTAFSQEKSSNAFLSVLENGTMVMADADGFFQCKAGDTNWQKVMDGLDTSFALTTTYCTDMVALEDESYYALFQNDEGSVQLMQYRYDPNAVNVVTDILTLFTVEESYLLQQAAAMYHRAHPEVVINIESAYSKMSIYTEEPDYNQVYQNLNTQLLAGEGADILVMDNLNIESYASKGLLADINDIIAPLEENGTLLSNITETYREQDGARYAVPLLFSMILGVGRDIEAEQMVSLEQLAQTLEAAQDNYMGSQTVEELVEQFYPYFAESIINGKELDRENLRTNLEYLQKIADNCGIISGREQDQWRYGVFDLASRAKLAFYETAGFNSAMVPVSVVNLIKGSYTSFCSAYFPKLQVGLNAKSEHLEIAKDFLAFALSEEVQNTDSYEGFSVNEASLETQSRADRSNTGAYTSIQMGDGNYEEFEIKAFSAEDAAKLVEICKTVNVRAKKDEKIKEELVNGLRALLEGSMTMEQSIDAIEGGLKMYLAE